MLIEGKNCWRVVDAARAAFLIDADAYFSAFRQAVSRARHRVIMVGWDIDSRVRLGRPAQAQTAPDAPPATLLSFLNDTLAQRPELRVYALPWDFSVIFTLERELLPSFRFAWKAHPRLSFRLDDAFPFSGAHHQKIVAIDGTLAFAGGVDLAIRRWDTPAHLADDMDRVDPNGRPYPPIHDIQMMVDGEAASALDEIVRERWQAATGEQIPSGRPKAADRVGEDGLSPSEPVAGGAEGEGGGPHPLPSAVDDLWPADVSPDVRDVRLGIARTASAFRDAPAVTEIASLTLDAIAAARRWIYIENQYLTSAAAAAAIARRLAEPDGPEIVAVLPRQEHGWLEQSSMGVMRAAVLRRLSDADRHGRLRLLHPIVDGLREGCVNVHAKVMIVDDTIARVGSANLSNRSMGLDTECDLVLDAELNPSQTGAIASFRNRLLAEHLGASPEAVAGALQAHGSLIAAIDSLRGGTRSLEPLPPPDDSPGAGVPLDLTFLDGLVCDPERPAPDKLLETFLPEAMRPPVRRSLNGWVLGLAALVAIVAVWWLTPLPGFLDIDRLAALGRALAQHRAAPFLVMAAYVAGGLLFFPISLLLGATALVFSPPTSIVFCLSGALISASVTYWIGRFAGRLGIRWLRGPRLQRISRHLRDRGIIAIVTARTLPVGNFSLFNLSAGALGIRYRDFVIGNLIGMFPGVLGLTLFADRLLDTLRHPHPKNVMILLTVVASFFLLMAWLRRRLGKKAS